MIDQLVLGKNIADNRKKLEMTQEDLACYLFITRQALSKWENGISYPSLDILERLTKLFKISFEELLGIDNEKEINPDDIFSNHSREYVVRNIIENKVENLYLPDVFYLFSPQERMIILKAIKENKIQTDFKELDVKLTESEKMYLKKEIKL